MDRLITLLNNFIEYIRSVKFSCKMNCMCSNTNNDPESPKNTPNSRHREAIRKLSIGPVPPITKPPSNYVKNRIIKNSIDFNKTSNDSGRFSLHMSSERS